MESKVPPPADNPEELTRQLEMLMQGLTLSDAPLPQPAEAQPDVKRRTLDDMRRLSEHIKKVPVYSRK